LESVGDDNKLVHWHRLSQHEVEAVCSRQQGRERLQEAVQGLALRLVEQIFVAIKQDMYFSDEVITIEGEF